MESLGIGLVVLAFAGLLVYYVRKAVNSERNEQALDEQNKAQADALVLANKLAGDKEREERLNERIEVVSIGSDRERANQLLRDAVKDDLN